MALSQPDLFGAGSAMPHGLAYADNLIAPADGDRLVERFRGLPFQAFDFHGFKGLRRVVSFGWRYDFRAGRLTKADPIPDFLQPLLHAAAGFARLDPVELRHALVTEYASGAPIGWHRDRPEFGKVIGVSFLSPCVLRFRRRTAKGWDRFGLNLAPRSAYLLDGEARQVWEHSIAPAPAPRYSVTFRTFR
jgi:alkylated DNA repair dioxygenase AlkB